MNEHTNGRTERQKLYTPRQKCQGYKYGNEFFIRQIQTYIYTTIIIQFIFRSIQTLNIRMTLFSQNSYPVFFPKGFQKCSAYMFSDI